MELQPIIITAGLLMGLLVGLTGMGGGALMTPFLIFMGVRPTIAVGTDLFQMMFTKSFGAWQHHRQGSVNYRVVLPLIAGSLPGAMAGVVLLRVMEESLGIPADVFLTRLLGVVLTLRGRGADHTAVHAQLALESSRSPGRRRRRKAAGSSC